jgi:hypothetical protein
MPAPQVMVGSPGSQVGAAKSLVNARPVKVVNASSGVMVVSRAVRIAAAAAT